MTNINNMLAELRTRGLHGAVELLAAVAIERDELKHHIENIIETFDGLGDFEGRGFLAGDIADARKAVQS